MAEQGAVERLTPILEWEQGPGGFTQQGAMAPDPLGDYVHISTLGEWLRGKEAQAVVVDFLDSWRFCPVSEASGASARPCLEDAAKQLLEALAAAGEGDGPEQAGRCQMCGQFVRDGGISCAECGPLMDREAVGL